MPLHCKVRSKTPELVLLVYGHGILTGNDINHFCTFYNTHLHGEDPFKILFDLRSVKTASIKGITSITRHMAEFEKLAQEKVIATSVLVDAYTTESLLNLLFSANPPATPTKVTRDLTEACNFLNGES